MYIHVFAFRWKAGTSELEKQRVTGDIVGFQGKVAGLLETHVGTNDSPRGKDTRLEG